MSRIVVVNAGPRKGWNTDLLLTEAAKGAKSAGVGAERFDLFRLERYTGCISCFGCKKEKNRGRCVCRDGLTPMLDAIREADGLIIGSPNYLGNLTASFRVLSSQMPLAVLFGFPSGTQMTIGSPNRRKNSGIRRGCE